MRRTMSVVGSNAHAGLVFETHFASQWEDTHLHQLSVLLPQVRYKSFLVSSFPPLLLAAWAETMTCVKKQRIHQGMVGVLLSLHKY